MLAKTNGVSGAARAAMAIVARYGTTTPLKELVGAPPSLDPEPIDAGCPYCGAHTAHPTSMRPAVVSTVIGKVAVIASPVVKAPAVAEPTVAVPVLARPDGQLAYETWLRVVGHGSEVGTWDKLTPRVQAMWTEIARVIEHRTLAVAYAEQKRRYAEAMKER